MSSTMGKAEKIEKIVDAVYLKTTNGSLRWEMAKIGSTFSTRFDDYIITVDRGPVFLDPQVTLTIKKIDGTMIAHIDRPSNIISSSTFKPSPATFAKIDMLFKYLDGMDEDLDDLLSKLT